MLRGLTKPLLLLLLVEVRGSVEIGRVALSREGETDAKRKENDGHVRNEGDRMTTLKGILS